MGSFVFFQVLNAETGIEIKKDLVYATKDNLELNLDAYLPVGSKLRPSVLVIHGGGWRFGSKRQLAKYASGLAGRGFNAFAINYRLAPQHKHPAQIEDCRDAVRWIKKNSGRYGGDPDRIGALGYSAGAHLACMLAVTGQEKAGNEIGTKILVAAGGGTPCEFISLRLRTKHWPIGSGVPRESTKGLSGRITARAFRQGGFPHLFSRRCRLLVGMSGARKCPRNEEIRTTLISMPSRAPVISAPYSTRTQSGKVSIFLRSTWKTIGRKKNNGNLSTTGSNRQ